MARLAKYNLSKVQEKMNAANTKPEKPRFGEQLGIEKTLHDMRSQDIDSNSKIDNEMYGELSEKWKGNGGGSGGDAFITGLTSGLKKGANSEEKNKNKEMIKFTETMRDMVSAQNQELFKQEKLSNARMSVTPRIMAYLDNYKTMSPSDRKVYLQNSLEEYNKSAGTNYKLIDTAGAEPWKVMVSNDGDIEPLDLMDFIKTPEEKKLDYYYKSAENNQYEKELAQEDNLERQVMQSKISSNQEIARQKHEKAMREEENSPQKIQEKKQKMLESGEIPKGSLLFDELPKHEAAGHFKNIMDERAKLNGAEEANYALDKMEKIFEEYPGISTSFAKWAEAGDDSAMNNFLRRMSNQDERAALQDLEKYAGKLNLGTIEQFKGTRPTDVLKKIMAATNPNSKFTAKAFREIKPDYVNQNNRQIARSKEADRAVLKRYVPTYEGVVENFSKKESVNVSALQQEKEALLREKEEMMKKGQH